MDETTKFTSHVSWAVAFCVRKTVLSCSVDTEIWNNQLEAWLFVKWILCDLLAVTYYVQVHKPTHPGHGAIHICMCNCDGVAHHGNLERILACAETALGGVPEQVLHRGWLHVQSSVNPDSCAWRLIWQIMSSTEQMERLKEMPSKSSSFPLFPCVVCAHQASMFCDVQGSWKFI